VVTGLIDFGERWSVVLDGETWEAEKLVGDRGARQAGIQASLGNANGNRTDSREKQGFGHHVEKGRRGHLVNVSSKRLRQRSEQP
jgi:hypothetical protein